MVIVVVPVIVKELTPKLDVPVGATQLPAPGLYHMLEGAILISAGS